MDDKAWQILLATSQGAALITRRGFKMRYITGLSDIPRHVIGFRSTQETRVQSALDDWARQILLATS